MENTSGKSLKCLLVQSKFSEFSFYNFSEVCKIAGAKYPSAPLGMMTVAALLPQHWEFKLVDENVEELLEEHFEWADLVGTGGMLPQQQGMLSVIKRAHQHGCRVVVGGPDPTSQPHLYMSADYQVLNEGEITIPMFLEAFEKGQMSGTFKSEDMADMSHAVVPRFDLIRFDDYLQVGIQYSRGCPFNCDFCDIIELYGRIPRTKTSEQVISELQSLYDLGFRGNVDFVDDNFIGNKKNVKKVLPDIKVWSEKNRYPFHYSTEASINLAYDEKLMQMMKDIDFRLVFIGIETPDNEILHAIQKKQNLDKSVTESIAKINSYGMMATGGFIIGFDNESDKSADSMIHCIQDSGICMALLGKLYALPNTQLTKRLKEEGRLFEGSATHDDDNVLIDQTIRALNFVTDRPRLNVLRDYVRVISYVYDPKNYYQRLVKTSLNLRPVNKYRPPFFKMLKTLWAFLKVCKIVGFNKRTGWLYWKSMFIVLFKNPRAIETTINMSAMFIHFYKASRMILTITQKEIESIERIGEDKFNEIMLQKDGISRIHQETMSAILDQQTA